MRSLSTIDTGLSVMIVISLLLLSQIIMLHSYIIYQRNTFSDMRRGGSNRYTRRISSSELHMMSTVVVKNIKTKASTNSITNVIQNNNIERKKNNDKNNNNNNNNDNQNNHRHNTNSYDNDDEVYKHNQAKYLISPSTPRHEISAKFTVSNKKYLDVGLKLRSQYTKLKLLTADEEIIAAKFSQVGKKLDMIKKYMENKLQRTITIDEWAKACKLNIAQLSMYRDMAHSARNKLVQHNIRLVDFWTIRLIEHSKNAKQISYYELLSEGIIGLRKAADLYDGSTRFIKYAKVFILSELYRGMTTLRPGM